MLNQSRLASKDQAVQTVRSLRALLGLCVACALFVAVAVAVVATPAELPVARTPALPIDDAAADAGA